MRSDAEESKVAEVVTGEAVVLDLTVARFPSRILALLIDVLVQMPVLFFVQVVASLSAGGHLNNASQIAVSTAGTILVVGGYPVIFETLSRGKTLGKLALGIRVVCDDGSPVRFRQSLIRGLSLAFIELWNPLLSPIGLPAGLITSMVSAKGKRLGDMFAGTFVIQERVPRRPDLATIFTVVPPQLVGWAAYLELSRLSDATAASASSYLRRFYELRSPAREQLGIALATSVAAQVSPPPPAGTDAAAFLAAVLATRRQRELARLQARYAEAPPAGVTPQGTLIASRHDGDPSPQPVAAPGQQGGVTVSQTEPLNGSPAEDPGFAAPF